MTASRKEASPFDSALRELRVSLAEAEMPPGREDELRAACRARASADAAARATLPARARVAAAAVAVLGVAVLVTIAGNIERDAGLAVTNSRTAYAPDPRAAGPATTLAGNNFQPLLSGPAYSPSASYSIVRVRIPLSALAPGSPPHATIEADVLVGEDGLASGIRFNPPDTVLVSTVSK